jgi:15-cis-phytoene synthase
MTTATYTTPKPATRSDWSLCYEVAREHGRTFYFASKFLPTPQRKAILAAYAFCRIADDIADRMPELGRDEAFRRLDAWEAELERPVHPVAVAYAEARWRWDSPAQPARDLIAGVRMDLDPKPFRTWDDLSVYCYHVAGTVGLIAAPFLGCTDPVALPKAVDLGIAMQLTNILRDVAEDARMGRIYLPLEDLERFGVSMERLLAGEPSGRFRELMAFEIARARAVYANAMSGIPALSSPGRLTTLASARLYAKILDRIEDNDYDVFNRRAYVPTARKMTEMPSICAAFVRMSL